MNTLSEYEVQYEIKYKEDMNALWGHLQSQGFRRIGEGLRRIVWLMPDKKWILKIPANLGSINANHSEAIKYAEDLFRKAKCYLVGDFLVMEYVEDMSWNPDTPTWTYKIDCNQVGYNADGQLVAYDYE